MTDTITLREACKHGYYDQHHDESLGGWWCPGGRERRFKRAVDIQRIRPDAVWVEVTDETL